MKILTLILITSFFVLSCLNAQEISTFNDRSKNNLKARVKAVTTKVYFAVDNFGKIAKGQPAPGDNSVILFDRTGNLVEQSKYDIDGSLEEKWVWLYEKGNIAQERKVFGRDFAPQKSAEPRPLDISWKYNYSFNVKGKIRYSTTHYRERKQDGYDVFRVSDSSVYEYHRNGRLSLKKAYSYPKENTWPTAIYDVGVSIYNNYGLLILYFRCTEFYGDSSLPENRGKIYPHSFSDEEFGQLLDNSRQVRGKMIKYDTLHTTSYTYDEHLLVRKKLAFKYAPHILIITNYKYNENDDLIEENVVGGTNTHSHSFTYEYDATGNWTSKIQFVNRVATYFYEREIEYFQ